MEEQCINKLESRSGGRLRMQHPGEQDRMQKRVAKASGRSMSQSQRCLTQGPKREYRVHMHGAATVQRNHHD